MRTIIAASLLILLAAVACGTETPEPVATTEPTATVASTLPTNTPVPSPTVEPTPTPTPTSTPTPVEIADGLARLWVDDNKDLIITELLGVFTVEVPLAGQLSDTVLRGKATENLDIVFAVPSRIGEGLYRLPVKAETDLEFDLPLGWDQGVYRGSAFQTRISTLSPGPWRTGRSIFPLQRWRR